MFTCCGRGKNGRKVARDPPTNQKQLSQNNFTTVVLDIVLGMTMMCVRHVFLNFEGDWLWEFDWKLASVM
jgi:hypothetical protein